MTEVDFFRNEAAQCREQAEQAPNFADKSRFLQLARHYDREARNALSPEQRVQSCFRSRV